MTCPPRAPRSLRLVLVFLLLGAALLPVRRAVQAGERPPNVVILLADDLGYGDLGCYGHPSIRTPNLDRLAAEGMRFTDFYSCAEVCTPSRAGLLTGRLPVRSGMCSQQRRVLFPNSTGGLPASEETLAARLKGRGYATACIGKWHLGHLPQYLPTRHGFDTYYGIPYSNDMDRQPGAGPTNSLDPKVEWFRVPLIQGESVIERPARQETLTQRYTEQATAFVRANRRRPFFLYLPYTMPHVPLFASERFRGKSPRGLYGDTVEEIDWSVGEIVRTLRELRLDRRTLVVFTSDNGPWLTQGAAGGSAGLLREGKGSTWEGGMRVPGIAWWPGTVRPGVVERALASNLDLFPTACELAGVGLPADRPLDGVSLVPVLRGRPGPRREEFFYYRGPELWAIRRGPFKAHFRTKSAYGRDPVQNHDPPLLYHLDHDPSEQRNVAAEHPEVVRDLVRRAEEHRRSVQPGPDQLVGTAP